MELQLISPIFSQTDFTASLVELITGHWVKALCLVIGALLSFGWRYLMDRRAWNSRLGMETLHLSCNTIESRTTVVEEAGPDGSTTRKQVSENWLILDGIFEDDLGRKVSNRYVRQLIRRAVAQTTEQQPFLRFGTTDTDHWFVMNMLRMGIAEIKGPQSLEKLGGETACKLRDEPCVFAATYERWPGMRQGKIRIMLARESDVVENRFAQAFRYEDEHHADRPRTLVRMTEDYNGPRQYTMMIRLPVEARVGQHAA